MPKILNTSKNKDINGIHDNSHSLNMSNRCEMILSMEDKILQEETYILGLCGTQNEPEFRFAAALSDYSSVIYNVGETLSKIITLTENTSPIVGIKFSPNSKNILYTATKDGSITVCDLRARGKIITELKDNSAEGKLRPLASFDISCDDKLVAAGTEHVGGDAFILFWDIRNHNSKSNSTNNLLGGYWESLMDDVTTLSFHSHKQNTLISGSTDGLINVFDLTQPTEDLALSYSLNTESSVDRLGWLDDDNIWCTTHTHSLQLWKCEDACPYIKYDRNSIENYLNESADSGYLVNMHNPETLDQPFLLIGSSSIKGENLHGVIIDANGLEVCYDFVGNQQTVRDSWYHKSGLLVTGGESGIINIWKPSESSIIPRNSDRKSSLKINGKDKVNRTKPY